MLVGKDGRARVTDFGLARSSGDTERPSTPIVAGAVSLETPLTVAGSVMGTPGYMAPEQYLGQESTPATDQYAFCATLYEALYGQRPFVANDLQTMARLTQAGEVPAPPSGSPVPGWLFPLIAKGLSPNEKQRHASMSALLDVLASDPSTRRRRIGLTAAALVVTLGVATALWGWPTVRASSCHRETERLASVWNADSATRVEQAFLATGQPFAPTAVDFVRSRLDGFMKAWADERHRACDETLSLRSRTERQLSLRLACLERRRIELQTLARRFEQADVGVVTQAAAAVSRLTTVERCANVDLLEQRASLSDALRLEAESIEQQVAEGRMLVALGRYDDARAMLTAAVSEARVLEDPQTLARASFELGFLEREADRYAQARPPLDEALRLALAARDDATALRTLGVLTSLVGWRLELPAEGLALVNVGRGLLPHVNDLELEALLDEGDGDSRWLAGDSDGALAAYRHALELLVRVQGPAGLDVARMHSSIGWVLSERGELTKAMEAYERSKRLREALLGEGHPTLGTTWNELGFLAREFDDRAETVTRLRRAYELRLRTKGPDSQISGRSAVNLAGALIRAGQLDEAGVLLRAAEPVLAPFATSGDGFEKIRCRFLLASKDLDGALASATRLKEIGVGESSKAENEGLLGQVLAARGDDAQAVHHLAAAVTEYARLKMTRRQRSVEFVLEHAEALFRLKAPASRAAAQNAFDAASQLEGNTRLKARTALLLANAHLANGATDQARQLAAQAITFAVEPDQQALKAEAERLLAAHPLD